MFDIDINIDLGETAMNKIEDTILLDSRSIQQLEFFDIDKKALKMFK